MECSTLIFKFLSIHGIRDRFRSLVPKTEWLDRYKPLSFHVVLYRKNNGCPKGILNILLKVLSKTK